MYYCNKDTNLLETNVLKFLIIITNHHKKLSHSYIPVMFPTIKTPISFASEQLKTSTYGKRTNHF